MCLLLSDILPTWSVLYAISSVLWPLEISLNAFQSGLVVHCPFVPVVLGLEPRGLACKVHTLPLSSTLGLVGFLEMG